MKKDHGVNVSIEPLRKDRMIHRQHWILVSWALCILVVQLVGCAPATADTSAPSPTLPLTDCQLSAPMTTLTIQARCGTLTVPENRANPSGRQLDLHVAVVPAVSRAPKRDPLVILVGGPGQAATEVYPIMARDLQRLRQDRDIILMDQRGTGQSHPLVCDLPEDEALNEEEAIDHLQACAATLDADLRFYTTEIAMRDLDAVRGALGYETLNLYGASYGTRAALTYLRMYPARVRSLVLDGVVSPDYRLFLNTAQDADRALTRAFARCAASADCDAAFPQLETDFDALLADLATDPVTTVVPDPVTTKPLTLTLEPTDVTGLVFPALYTPETVALLPLTIQQARAGDFAPLIAQAGSVEAGLSRGMFYAVACTEDAPRIDPAEAEARAEDSRFGDMTEPLREICTAWPQGTLSDDFGQPVVSDVPALLLSGEVDPVTPPRYAEEVAEKLSNSRHLVGPGMGHGLIGRGCVSNLVTDFVIAGSAADLDATCVQQLAPPPFFASPNGPEL